MEEAKITFYKISSCGYYPYGKKRQAEFGTLEDTLRHISAWSTGRSLAHTRTHGKTDASVAYPAYFVDASPGKNSWLLTLWNESANTDGKVVAIDGFAAVGAADVSETEVEEGHIPGHATYFWLLPAENLMATIRFQHPMAGVYEMGKFISGFLNSFGPHVVLGEPDEAGSIAVVGYRKSAADELGGFRPSFKTEIFKKPGPIDYVVAHAPEIRKIKKKASLQLKHRPKRALWQKMLEDVNLTKYKTVEQEVAIYYELEVSGLDAGQVQEIVQQWSEDDDELSDYGFVLRGDSKTHWLGRSYARDTLELDVVRNNIEIVKPESLLHELERYRGQLLKLLEN
ncbi:hypothetical protein [Comamonas testosteroni]|uniref:hypothetical protein n=1 Tax=Comamonas testosteroni TaxID=285 RepID=UPI0015F95D34|nr:hypothetical protein [Comamonas testosteroni]